MKIVLFDMQEQVCEAWGKEFNPYGHDVTIFHGNLEDVPQADCLVAAGNSFGIMDGGLDAAMKLQFPDAQKNVTEAIQADYLGEIPVGQSVIVPTYDDTFPWMAYTPTMRFPRNIPAEAVYDSMRATLLAVRLHNVNAVVDMVEADEDGEESREFGYSEDQMMIDSIAIPGLGARTGGVGAFKAAKMMRMAYESIHVHDVKIHESWDQVEGYLKDLYR